MPLQIPPQIREYYAARSPMVCELPDFPSFCEFFPAQDILQFNEDYQVSKYAPGYFLFATNGGGELIAIAPNGAIVALPEIGINPDSASEIAPSWTQFQSTLSPAA